MMKWYLILSLYGTEVHFQPYDTYDACITAGINKAKTSHTWLTTLANSVGISPRAKFLCTLGVGWQLDLQ